MFPSTSAHVGLGISAKNTRSRSPEFRGEAEDSRAEASLFIGDGNIKKCLGQIHPQIEHDTEDIKFNPK